MSSLFRFLFSDLRLGCMVFCICTSAGGDLYLHAQNPQTLRGILTDKYNDKPLEGVEIYAYVSALGSKQDQVGQAITNENGEFQIDIISGGEYETLAQFTGYIIEPQGIQEYSITYVNGTDEGIPLTNPLKFNNPITFQPVEVRSRSLTKLNSTPIDLIDFDRKPAIFNDPARLIALQPGVVQTSDQANHLVVRGNSPNKNLWLLNGLAIVNPNHTANAGTISDQPTLSGGGVNALSPQLLYNSRFYASGLPAKYGNAPGGAFALELRPGAVDSRRYRALASFIGIDLTAENYMQPDNPYSWSYLATYRYSFTGLLADFGVDFGGEEIRFQDAGLHLHKWTRSGGAISLFGLYGNSSNIFRGPAPSEIMEDKDEFDIDFESDMLILTGRWQQPIGQKGKMLSVGAAYSEINPDRQQRLSGDGATLAQVDFTHRRTNLRIDMDLNNGQTFGFSYLRDDYDRFDDDLLTVGEFGTDRSVSVDRYAIYSSLDKKLGEQFSFSLGAELGMYGGSGENEYFVSPRMLLSHAFEKGELFLIGEIISGLQIENQRFINIDDNLPISNQRIDFGYKRSGIDIANWSVNLFGQHTPEEYALRTGSSNRPDEFLLGDNNNLAAPSNQVGEFITVSSRRYGLEASWSDQVSSNGWRLNFNGSLFRAETQLADDTWTPDRWSYGWTAQAGTGKDWMGTSNRGKERILGFSLVAIARGGERRPPFRPVAFPGQPIEDFSAGFTNQLRTYFRPDLRLYREVKGEKVTTTLALDVQNVAGIENEAFQEFDFVTDRVETRMQLGVIPVLSYRLVWN
ncbi:MAG: hypothetical protein AAF741_03545 [Bacteroidota bacterium]